MDIRSERQIEYAVASYSAMLYRVAFSIVSNRSDAEDVVQEVFLRWTKKNGIFNSCEHEKAWLIRATINRAKSCVTSAWKKRVVLSDNQIEVSTQNENTYLLEAVSHLPPKQRLVVHLFYYEDMPVNKIADVANMPENTVKSHLKRARESLKEMLKGEDIYGF